MRRLGVVAALLLAGCGGGGADRVSTTAPRATTTTAAQHSPVAPAPPLPGEHWGAALRLAHTPLRARPGVRARVLARVPLRTGFGSRSVLAVVRQRGHWLGVVAPELGNGRVGWVRDGSVRLLRETWEIDVDLSKRQAQLRHRSKLYRAFPVAVGTSAYSTPTGRFGVTDRLKTGGPGSPYGCCVLALSGRQPNIAQDWPGGDRIAIHGTNEAATVGTAASHGCLRATEQTMRLLMSRVPLGTPVVIHA